MPKRYFNLSDLAQSTNYMPQWALFMLDICLAAFSYIASFWIGKGIFSYSFDRMDTALWVQVSVVIAIQAFCFLIFGTYKGILRLSTFVDTLKILGAILTATLAALLLNFVFDTFTDVRIFFLNTTLVIYFLLCFLILYILRVAVKTAFEFIVMAAMKRKNVLIWGCDAESAAIAKMLRSDNRSEYRVVGFVDDNSSGGALGHSLLGMHVYPLDQHLPTDMKVAGISYIIVSTTKMKTIDAPTVFEPLLENNINILSMQRLAEWNSEESGEEPTEAQRRALRQGKINAIRIEDLLERPIINVDTENVRQVVKGKVVMVTGAAGSIGSELVRQILRFEPKAMVLFEMAESPLHDLTLDLQRMFPKATLVPLIGDVRNVGRVEEVMSDMRPDVVYHAAAYKHVPLMENHPNEAVRANVQGTKNMADMAVKYGVGRFVMISTDKAVNPTNVMGASKRIAEIYVQSLSKTQLTTRFITTRFGNVLGSNGSVIPYFKKQIAEGGPVTVTHPDIIRYFMTIPEACTLVMEASTLGRGGEIFVFDMGRPVKILDLAKNMIRLAGYVPGRDIEIEFTGLRPGEKLYEELLNQKETTLPTQNPKIMVAKVREYEFDIVKKDIQRLIDTAYSTKAYLTVKRMKEIVPEFRSKNSAFESLDK